MHRMQQAAWFAAGMGLGIASTWILATPKGRRARRKAARMMEERCDQLHKASTEVVKRGLGMVDSSKEIIKEGTEFVRETGAEIGRRLQFATK